MQCLSPITLFGIKGYETDGLTVPCGKCLSCRIAKRSEWTMRLLHELDDWEKASFITLTYDNNHLPLNPKGMKTDFAGTLNKKDLQKFFKRLRKRLDGRKIKYFACGEYGDDKARPHYHAIVFGVDFTDEDRQAIKDCWKLCDWSKVHSSSIGSVTHDSIQYVAGYINKKYSGELAEEEYVYKGREPVFRVMSAGLGLNYVLKNKEQMLDNKFISYKGVKKSIPRYYLNKCEVKGSDLHSDAAVERDSKTVKKYTGVKTSDLDFYKNSSAEDYRRYNDKRLKGRSQYGKNLQAKLDLDKKRNKT